MNIQDLINLAKQQTEQDAAQKQEDYYTKTIAWFHYLGLIRHNKIAPQRCVVTLKDALNAGRLEPRVLELLPAIMVVLPKVLKFKKSEIPKDLATQIELIRKRKPTQNFRGIEPWNYLHWLKAPAMEIARRRLDFQRAPRLRTYPTHAIGEFIRDARMRLSYTQKQLADKYDLSLRVIRDLEQGKLDASLKTTNEILNVFGECIRI
jgi:DNA-binding XRE family transcriptional regulator